MSEVELMPGQTMPGLPPEGQPAGTPPADGDNQGTPPAGHTPSEAGIHKSAKQDRPEWLPEKFFKDGQPDTENLAKSYTERERKIGQRKEEVIAEVREELTKDSGKPESPDNYTVPELEGINMDELKSHPMVEWFRGFAHQRGLSDKDFQEAVGNYVNTLRSEQLDPAAEMKKLGDDAEARIAYVANWINANISDPDEQEIYRQEGATADGIRRIEKIIKARSSTTPDLEKPGAQPDKSYEEIKALMASPAYNDPTRRNMAVVNEVTAWFERNADKIPDKRPKI